MQKITIVLITLLLISTQAQAAEKELKMGYADLYKIFAGYDKTKASKETLEKKAENKNKEREKLAEEVRKLREEATLLSATERAKKEEVILEKSKELLDFDRATREELDRESDSMERDLIIEIGKGIETYGKEKGYDLILDSRTLFYADENLDISSDILEDINK